MVSNLVTRKPTITVDGLDVSTAITGLVWGYTDYESQSGIIKTEGTLTLQSGGLNWTEDLDTRTNPRWARGKIVRIQISDESVTPTTPVCGGWQYILKSEWDGNQILTLKIGCILALMDAATPPGEGLEGFSIGSTQGSGSLFARLSNRIGVPINGGLSGFSLNVPLSKLTNDSPVRQLGQLCWASARIAYTNGTDGEVYVVPVNASPAPILDRWVERDAVEYLRRTGAEAPCEKVLVTGTKIEAVEPEDDVIDPPTETYGRADIVNPNLGSFDTLLERRTEYETLDRGNRVKVEYSKVEQPYGLAVGALPIPDDYLPDDDDRQDKWDVIQAAKALNIVIGSEITTTSQYEKKYISGGGSDKIDERRILSKETLGKRQAELVYQSYNDARIGEPGDEDYNGAKVSLTGLTEADRTLISYAYRDIPSGSITVTRSRRPILEIITEQFKRRAEVYPDASITAPTAWQWIKRETKQWLPDTQTGGWKIVTVTETPALLDSQADITEYASIDAIQGAKRTKATNRGPTIQPPKPETFPVDALTEETQIVGIARLPGLATPAIRDREREYRAEPGMLKSKAQAEKVAKVEGAILWGRFNGCEFIMNVANRLLSASPLQAIDWTEAKTGKVMRYLIDGLSFAYSERRTIASADGIWVGQVGTRTESPPTAPIDPVLPDVEDETEQPVELRPYRKVLAVAPALKLFMGVKITPYSLQGKTLNVAPALALKSQQGIRQGAPATAIATAGSTPDPDPQPAGVVTVTGVANDDPDPQSPATVEATAGSTPDPDPQPPATVQVTGTTTPNPDPQAPGAMNATGVPTTDS